MAPNRFLAGVAVTCMRSPGALMAFLAKAWGLLVSVYSIEKEARVKKPKQVLNFHRVIRRSAQPHIRIQ
jgi:hypothetical protein